MAAAAFNSTASRTGPTTPASTDRATPALKAASAPRRSSSVAGANPSDVGSKLQEVTAPSATTHTVDVPVVVSSSSPSSPRNTRASAPRAASTPAITGASRASETPTACAAGRAGLVSGPSTLKTVGTPISRRGTAACRIPGWKTGAKQKAMPASARHGPTAAGGRSTTTPSSSSRSAEPQAEDAARLPCLTTGTPAPATTSAAIVEMLTVCARSPPVPQVSTTRPGTLTCAASASIASTNPATSSGVSPLARSATTNAATCTGVASPVMTSRIAHSVSAAASASPRSSVASRPGQVCAVKTRLAAGGAAHRQPGLAPAQQLRRRLHQLERVDRVLHDGVGQRPGRQPPVVAAGDQHERRRAVDELVLELLRQPQPARGP